MFFVELVDYNRSGVVFVTESLQQARDVLKKIPKLESFRPDGDPNSGVYIHRMPKNKYMLDGALDWEHWQLVAIPMGRTELTWCRSRHCGEIFASEESEKTSRKRSAGANAFDDEF